LGKISFSGLTEAELPEILRIYNYYVLNSTATFHLEPLSEKEMRELVFFNHPRYRTFVIRDESGILGYVLLCPFNKREAYSRTAEVTIYLRHDVTGKGVGGRALEFIEEFARQNGIKVLIAIICAENIMSTRLFQKNGYTECARYRQVGEKFGRLLVTAAYEKILDY